MTPDDPQNDGDETPPVEGDGETPPVEGDGETPPVEGDGETPVNSESPSPAGRGRVLVPIAVLESEAVPLGLMNLLSTMDVTVLGYHVLPEQTPPDQARNQYEDRATAALEDVADEFRQAGGDADHRLVFTHDRRQSIDRVADDVAASAYAITGATGAVDRVLVSLTGDVAVDRIVDFVADVVGDRAIEVTLFRAAKSEAKIEDAQATLDAAATRLRDRGLIVAVDLASNENAYDALIEAAPEHDAIVVGERAPSLQSLVFGDEARRIAAESVGPVLVVRRDDPDVDDDATEASAGGGVDDAGDEREPEREDTGGGGD